MRPADIVDTMLDRSVLLGFSTIGHRIRRTAWDDDDPASGALADRVAVVTGAGSWLGKATATALARLGASACPWLCRDVAWGRAAADEVEAAVPVHRCDVSDLAPVRAFAGELSESVDRVDVRVHNAGDATRAHRGRRPGPSGRGVLEWDARAKTAGRRPGVPHRDVCRATAYARTKRMQVALAPLMQERWAADGIAVHTIEAALRSCRGRG